MKKIETAEFIVDLYEVRACFIKPIKIDEPQDLEGLHKYNFFNQTIANLIDKYKVSSEDIKEVIKERKTLKLCDHNGGSMENCGNCGNTC